MKRKALIVGINKYKNQDWNLQGCVGDALSISSVLQDKFTFKRDNIRVLTDERATKEGIEERLEWLFSDLEKGDTAVFFFAGHGSQVLDRNNDELSDEKDEIIIPHDHSWDNPLTDDILAMYLSKANKQANVVVMLDCCNSGSGTRDLRDDERDLRVRYIEPPADIKEREYGNDSLKTRKFGEVLIVEDHILLSGCKDNQQAQELRLGKTIRGAFSYFLEQTLRDNTNITYSVLRDTIAEGIKRERVKTQDPQLECKSEWLNKKFLEHNYIGEEIKVEEVRTYNENLVNITLTFIMRLKELTVELEKILQESM